MKRLLPLALLALTGCLDFEGAKANCVANGVCAPPVTPDAPQLVATTPSTGSIDVDVDTALVLEFSKAMDKKDVTLNLNPPAAFAAPTWTADDQTMTVVTVASLKFSTPYSATVSGKSADGVSLPADSKFVFTTRAEPDKVAPTMIASSPLNNATSVPVAAVLSLTFSEAMNPDFFDVFLTPTVALDPPAWSNNGQTATWVAHPDLTGLTTYQLTVLQARDLSDNDLTGPRSVLFTTAAGADVTPPVIVNRSPPNGSVNIDVSTSPSVTFSEPMAISSAGAMRLFFADGGFVDAGCVGVFDPSATLLTCTHASPMQVSTGYVVKVDTTATDLSGKPLAAEDSFGFTTGLVPDTVRPTIVSYFPDAGSVNLGNTPVVVTFSEPMDQATTRAAVTVVGGALGVPSQTITFDATGTQMTFQAPWEFAPDAGVTLQVSASAKDLANNTLLANQQVSFGIAARRRHVIWSLGQSSQLTRYYQPAPEHYAWQNNPVNNLVGNRFAMFSGISATERALMTFDVPSKGGLPANTMRVVSASVEAYQTSSTAAPNSPFPITIVKLSGVPLTGDAGYAYNAPFCLPMLPCYVPVASTFASTSGTGARSFDISAPFASTLAADGGRLQYRLKSSQEVASPGVTAYVNYLGRGTPDAGPAIVVVYDAP